MSLSMDLLPHPVLPTMSGTCDEEKFYIVISSGNMGKNFNIMMGSRDMTPDRRAEYDIKENATHMSLAVPFLSSDVVFEVWLFLTFFFIYFFCV